MSQKTFRFKVTLSTDSSFKPDYNDSIVNESTISLESSINITSDDNRHEEKFIAKFTEQLEAATSLHMIMYRISEYQKIEISYSATRIPESHMNFLPQEYFNFNNLPYLNSIFDNILINNLIKSLFVESGNNLEIKKSQVAMIVNSYYSSTRNSNDINSAIDRFTYCWSAFNSLYRLFRIMKFTVPYNNLFDGLKGNPNFPNTISDNGITVNNSDSQEIKYWVRFRQGTLLNDTEKKFKRGLLYQYLDDNPFVNALPEGINETDMLQIAYWVRNNYIHGNSPLPVISNSYNLRLLNLCCNCLHEEVNNYWRLAFAGEHDEDLSQRIEEAAYESAINDINNKKISDETKTDLREYVAARYNQQT